MCRLLRLATIAPSNPSHNTIARSSGSTHNSDSSTTLRKTICVQASEIIAVSNDGQQQIFAADGGSEPQRSRTGPFSLHSSSASWILEGRILSDRAWPGPAV